MKWSQTQTESNPASSARRPIAARCSPIRAFPPDHSKSLISRPNFMQGDSLAARLVSVRERAAVRLGRPNLPRCIVAHATTPRAGGRMKAFALTVAEQPAALTDLPDPEIAPDEALVSVRAASVNGFDVYQASGGLMAMMPHELPTVIGRDLAGVVVAVGPDRTDVTVGEEVLGFVTSTPPLHRGTWAELVAGGPDLVLARKPADLSWEAAAAIPLAASTALDAVDAVDPKPGDTLLVMGATGGVGAFAVQLAVQRGARVIATAIPGE